MATLENFILGDLVDRGDGGVNGIVVGLFKDSTVDLVWVKVAGIDQPFTLNRSELALVRRSNDQWLRLHRDRRGNLQAGERTSDRAQAVAYVDLAGINKLVGLVHQTADGNLVIENLP